MTKCLLYATAGAVMTAGAAWLGFCWLLFGAEHEPRRQTTSRPTTPLGVLRAVS